MSMRLSLSLSLCLPLCLFALPAAAQPASHACATVADATARLACYDKAFPPPPEVIEEANEIAKASFGLDQPRDALRNPGATDAQADPERIESRIAEVDYGAQRRFTLDNGQVWMQTDARSGGHVRPGDVVQVRKAILGGYTLVMPNGVTLRVRRTR